MGSSSLAVAYKRHKMPEKKKHDSGFSLFPVHMWLYILYISCCLILAVFGTLLFICGNYASTGYVSLFAILNWPWPKVNVEDADSQASSLDLLKLSCWISGSFFWMFAIYLGYVSVVYHKLLWAKSPWEKNTWNGVRKAADKCLVQSKMRAKDRIEQWDMMNEKQQQEMKKFSQMSV